MDARRPATAPSLGRTVSIDVLDAIEKMGTTERLHFSHFTNLSIAATCRKHKALVEGATSMIDTKLHPFVQAERRRLGLRLHLRAVDELAQGHGVEDLPNALKHHATFAQVHSWIVTHREHRERMEKQRPDVSDRLPQHCRDYKEYRDKNRYKAMNDHQRRAWDRDKKLSYEQQVRREEKRIEGMQAFDAASPATFLRSATGLSPAIRGKSATTTTIPRSENGREAKVAKDAGAEKTRPLQHDDERQRRRRQPQQKQTGGKRWEEDEDEEGGVDSRFFYYEDKSPSEDGFETFAAVPLGSAGGLRDSLSKGGSSARPVPAGGKESPEEGAKVKARSDKGRSASEAMLRSVDEIMNGKHGRQKTTIIRHSKNDVAGSVKSSKARTQDKRQSSSRIQGTFFFL